MNIETKVNDPFLYFFFEPNIVFVYELNTENYVTLLEVRESESWKTFELNDKQTFPTFDHQLSNPLEGKAYMLEQADMCEIVKIINQHIHKNRRLSKSQVPVHLASSEAAAGLLRFSLAYPKTVIGFPDMFSIGPLWQLSEKRGQTARSEWLYENINFEDDQNEYEISFMNTLLALEDIPAHVPIYIWYAENADEQIGVRYMLHRLREKLNPIFLMNSGKQYTNQLEPESIKLLFEQRKDNMPLSKTERCQWQNKWQTLARSKDILHIYSNERIKGVPSAQYDPLIINTIEKLHSEQDSKTFIKTNRVIAEIIETNEYVNIYYLEYRIRFLIYSGKLELKGIPKSMHHYSVKTR
ncbi:DUF1835 domain-containing protein [Bacillus sp. FJAT-50079]|uniref:DUF1835 domain-containing protein n=1 Tax=Bacillus sp. FJAT-50079 TaxID=2833577 RepID=UPI001BC9FA7D|nr:DUF1835 domain-containing protein [Bacillus sp. FJAT-50079]MBS4207375.1 DUF1835 domain-containing protein [Bacillus sp. FJAT-50079]